MLNQGTYLQDRYEILGRIGSGGMSVVYKAKCHTLDRLVAIKVLKEEFASDENFVSKFKMEAQAAARLSHPNIVNVYDVVDEGNLHYIVMELIEGITLKSYIEKKGFLENKEAIGIAIQVAQGIAAAHEQHIIHRDIKPQNMIISRDGNVKVADFGIARAVSSQTMNATAVGSVHYISPEQARGGYCDERSDIYSFGITMYEMVTGRVPFEGDNTVAVALAHLETPITPPSQLNPVVSSGLEQIILKCTQKKPDRRYSSIGDVITDLRHVMVDPDYDIYGAVSQTDEENDPYVTRPISREELSQIQERRRPHTEDIVVKEPEYDPAVSIQTPETEENDGDGYDKEETQPQIPVHKKRSDRKKEKDVSTQFERIIMVMGIFAAVLVAVVVIFVFSRLTGLFWPKSGQDKETEVVTSETATEGINVSLADNQTYMPNVLGLPKDMAEAKLKEYNLVMSIETEDYSDNYKADQVMRQDVAEGEVVEKWSTVGVTISKGSDKVDLSSLGLEQLSGEDAQKLLKDKELQVTLKEEANDNIETGKVIRYSPQQAKAGDTIELVVSTGPKTAQGQVPKLIGRDEVTADALLKAAGLKTGTVTYDYDAGKPEGTVLSQSALPGTVLEPSATVDYVVNQMEEEGSTQAQAADESYYMGSIDTTCSLSNYIGPASQTSSVKISIRLKQKDASGAEVYTPLISPRLVVGSQDIPVVFPRIKGAYGVENGTVEVVDVEKDTVIASYPVSFFPVG
ncbi:MAG: Stk1 family PASTA domain-containing Ser/Thr kinase [Lachnospiraceae bacterium]|jgi:serine/threonine-protein kinase|nr:MAG: Stk1 family PASTA domain-containing Ser/Thr kinase [Lachnospiraceae bacterium]